MKPITLIQAAILLALAVYGVAAQTNDTMPPQQTAQVQLKSTL